MTVVISSLKQLNREIERARRQGVKRIVLTYRPTEKARQKADLSAWQRIKRKCGIPTY